jgi:hypothetical protein
MKEKVGIGEGGISEGGVGKVRFEGTILYFSLT